MRPRIRSFVEWLFVGSPGHHPRPIRSLRPIGLDGRPPNKPAKHDDFVVVSRAIHDEGRRPVYVYRSPSQQDGDSGWTATLGESPETITETHLAAAHVHHLAALWPELATVFADGRPESHWEWDPDAEQYQEVRPLP